LNVRNRPSTTFASSSGAEVVALHADPAETPEHIQAGVTPEEIAVAKARAEERDLNGWVNWLARPEKKVAIIGFTPTRDEAPWADPTFLKWTCNNLHLHLRPEQKWDVLFDLHPYDTIAADKPHEAFLRTTDKPVYVWQPRPEWPTSMAYPKDAVLQSFGNYQTNSISWMIGAAILEGVTELHIYGVDLAQGTEYSQQRPSCEHMLGIAQGRGIKIHIPLTSDLLKTGSLYGVDDDSFIHAKMVSREKELSARLQTTQQQINQLTAQTHQMMGALEDVKYWRGVWANPRANRDGSPKDDSKIEV
jgi:hypothetical protein